MGCEKRDNTPTYSSFLLGRARTITAGTASCVLSTTKKVSASSGTLLLQGDYVPEDLISLLDAGNLAGEHPSVIIDADSMFSEEVFGSYSQSRSVAS
jgi:hypothetical protein